MNAYFFWRFRGLWIGLMVISILAAVVYPVLTGMGMLPPLVLVEPRYMAVVRDIEAGKLPIGVKSRYIYAAGIKNRVDLPPRYRPVALKVFAERRPDGRLCVIFETWTCWHGDSLGGGYMYSTKPLTSADFFQTDGDTELSGKMSVCGWSHVSVEHLRGPWYRVVRNLD
jgi:hypothetical protein